MNRDFTYCKGKNCNLRHHCKRFEDGSRILKDGDQYMWMEHCDEETRECYIKN